MSLNNPIIRLEVQPILQAVYPLDQLQYLFNLIKPGQTSKKLQTILDQYFNATTPLELFLTSSDTRLYGLIGVELLEDNELLIHHIAVDEEVQWRGLGKMMLEDVINRFEPKAIRVNQIDELNSGFFEACGFQMEKTFESKIENDQFSGTKLIVSLD